VRLTCLDSLTINLARRVFPITVPQLPHVFAVGPSTRAGAHASSTPTASALPACRPLTHGEAAIQRERWAACLPACLPADCARATLPQDACGPLLCCGILTPCHRGGKVLSCARFCRVLARSFETLSQLLPRAPADAPAASPGAGTARGALCARARPPRTRRSAPRLC